MMKRHALPHKSFAPYKAPAGTISPPGAFSSGLPKDASSRGAFTSPRTAGTSSGARRKKMDSDDDEDSDEDADQSNKMNAKQQIGLYEDAISLEQVSAPLWR
jgi:hypothetical protein